MHTDLVTVLKRCAKGNQASFTILRQPQEVREREKEKERGREGGRGRE